MKILFMGTPDFAVPSLEALLDAGHTIVGVFTQPDKPKNRGQEPAPCFAFRVSAYAAGMYFSMICLTVPSAMRALSASSTAL